MVKFDFDLVVIGAGSGGVRAARMAAAQGARVVIVEAGKLGGTCVNVGCIPKKLYSYAAHYSADFADSRGFGWQLPAATFNWVTLRDRKTEEISRLNGIYHNMLIKAGVEIIQGWGQLRDAHTVAVGDKQITGRNILLSTGGKPQSPGFAGHDCTLSSDQIFDLPALPKKLLILGAGYIGVEFAGIFSGLGVDTTLSWRSELPLRGFDHDLRQRFMGAIGKHCHLLPNSQVQGVKRLPSGALKVLFADGTLLGFDHILAAIGRVPATHNLGLEHTQVQVGADGAVLVDANFQTTEPSVYAIGDVVGRMALTPVALAEAMVVVDQLFGNGERRLNYQNIPTAVFSHPNLATVGLTEEQARQQHPELAIYETDFRHLRHTLSGRDERTYMKVLVDIPTDKVLGMHMLGADAGEIIQGFATAMHCGLTKAQLDATIGIHPTAAEEFVTLRTRSR
jgi:glutathione reductase (NADPH)